MPGVLGSLIKRLSWISLNTRFYPYGRIFQIGIPKMGFGFPVGFPLEPTQRKKKNKTQSGFSLTKTFPCVPRFGQDPEDFLPHVWPWDRWLQLFDEAGLSSRSSRRIAGSLRYPVPHILFELENNILARV